MSSATAPRLLRVQVVSDDRVAADALSLLVQTWKYEASVDYGMVTALQTAFFVRPDVMLLDTGPSENNDARIVAEEVRKHEALKEIKLVAVLPFREESQRALAMKAGFDSYLARPVAPAILRALLKGQELALVQKGLTGDLLRLGTEQRRLIDEIKAKLRMSLRPSSNP